MDGEEEQAERIVFRLHRSTSRRNLNQDQGAEPMEATGGAGEAVTANQEPMEVDEPAMEPSKAKVPDMIRPAKIEKVVWNVIVPPGAGFHYFTWTTDDILRWLCVFYPNERLLNTIKIHQITGIHLHRCFLDPETSGYWSRANGIREGGALRVSMVLGRVHNIFYGYE